MSNSSPSIDSGTFGEGGASHVEARRAAAVGVARLVVVSDVAPRQAPARQSH
jgi:hypothetical protein